MTKQYSRILRFVCLGFILTLYSGQTFAVPCNVDDCKGRVKWTKDTIIRVNQRTILCSVYGKTENLDMGALICEAAWDHDASPDKLCELVIKAARAKRESW